LLVAECFRHVTGCATRASWLSAARFATVLALASRSTRCPVSKHSRQRPLERIRPPVHGTHAGNALEQAHALHAQGQLQRAALLYRTVLQREPDHSGALHRLGVLALQSGDLDTAVKLMSRTLELEPRNAQAHANIGSAYVSLRRPTEALQHYDQALALDPGFAGVFHNRGNLLQTLGRHEEAAHCFQRLLELAPDADFALGNLCHSMRHVCDWREYDAHAKAVSAGVRAGRRVIRPFALLSTTGSASEHLQCARTYARYINSAAVAPLWTGERYGHERIRIAYVSADFRDHVISHLVAPLFECHDRTLFDTIAVSLAGADDSDIVRRVKRSVSEFVVVARVSDEVAAQRIRRLGVDIAVDLTGYTQGARPGIFARRPAPIQVNYLGFPATLGEAYMDYILADEVVIPPTTLSHYTERVVHLPEVFQSNYTRQRLPPDQHAPTRTDVGLPEAGVVYCCFNNSYKLTPAFFDIWMRLLTSTPGSVLWLLGDGPVVQRNLRREAAARGIVAERLVFAARTSYADYLARLPLADLFLDTYPFNGGATVSDALWAGLPVVTCAGEAFAARMAGSLLRSVELPELVADSPEDYERRALQLARDRPRLGTLRSKLLTQRCRAPLFDTQRFCRHLEAAYREMWQRHRRGECPASFAIPAAA
jgi:protein O-GlcNAc transferase